MMKQHGNKLMQKWKNKAGVRLSALDKKKLVLTNLPYVLTAFYADRASCLYRRSPGEDIGNKLLYAMEHADRIFTGILLSFDLERPIGWSYCRSYFETIGLAETVRCKETPERNRVWFSQMGNCRGYQALYVGRSMDEHSIDSNRSTDHGEQTEATEVCKK